MERVSKDMERRLLSDSCKPYKVPEGGVNQDSQPEEWVVGPLTATYYLERDGQSDELWAKIVEHGVNKFEALSVGTINRQTAIIPLDNATMADATLIANAPATHRELKHYKKVVIPALIAGQEKLQKRIFSMKVWFGIIALVAFIIYVLK